jgi:CRISPR type IV-associated protein Csf3
MIPFALTCRVPLGVVAARLDEISIDGILAYVTVKRMLGETFYDPGHETVEPALPLARHEHASGWYWHASSAQGGVEMRDIHYWHRRFREQHSTLIDFAGKRGKVITEGGPMRDMRGALTVLYPETLTWFLLGDPDAVWAMVQEIPYIGKMRGQGQGRCHWDEPAPLEEDWSVWRGGELMRPIPAEEATEVGGDFDYEYRGLRPPYHDVAQRRLCAVRGRAA